jgi:hypothetical protein
MPNQALGCVPFRGSFEKSRGASDVMGLRWHLRGGSDVSVLKERSK